MTKFDLGEGPEPKRREARIFRQSQASEFIDSLLACRHERDLTNSKDARRLVSVGSSSELGSRQNSKLTGPRCTRPFSMSAIHKRGRHMASIKGVMLLPLDSESYRRHMAHHTFLAKVNSGTKTPDYRHELTQLVEERAFGRKCSCIFPQPGFGSCGGSKWTCATATLSGFANSMAFSRLAT